jgi:hypothetical protein
MDCLPTRDQEALFGDITNAERPEIPPIQLSDWIQFAKPVVSYVKTNSHLRIADNSDIRDFFLPQQSHPAPPPQHATPAEPHTCYNCFYSLLVGNYQPRSGSTVTFNR